MWPRSENEYQTLIEAFLWALRVDYLRLIKYYDVLTAMERGQITLLGMFDLSAAFDTVDHAILLRRLEISFGIRGVALSWFASYLSGRSQQVSVHGTLALSTFLEYGVPQGTVLGPVLSLMYTADLVGLVRSFGLFAHGYADDLQVYCHLFLGRNTFHCNVFGVAQILLVDGCPLIG